jgi:hypothetical protein
MNSRISFLLLATTTASCALLSGACGSREVPMSSADSQAAHVREVVAAGGVVDSILPIDEQLRRFRADLREQPDTLRYASASIDALVQRWGKAVASRDTSELNAMTLDRAEFAWLYYPGSKLSKPPYEAPPQLLWGQIMSNSNSGAKQLLERFGGKRFVIEKVLCPAASDTTAASLVYSECRVRAHAANGKAFTDRLFGSIVEHRGRFKFLGYANGL